MFHDVLRVSMLGDDSLQPCTGESPGLDVLVMRRVVDVLCKADVERYVSHDSTDSGVGIGGGDLLGVGTKLDEVLQKDLEHIVE